MALAAAAPRVNAPVGAGVADAIGPLLAGPLREGVVTAVVDRAVLVAVDGTLLALTDHDAVRLPCAMVLHSTPAARVGDRVVVGAGSVLLGDLRIAPARWWRVPRPVLRDVPVAAATAAAALAGPQPPQLPYGLLEPARALAAALDGGAGVRSAVSRLLGLGPGLTPAGDDVLAGALVALRAAGSATRADELARDVAAARPEVTTTLVSVALLRHAERGECVPELSRLLAVLDTGGPVGAALAALDRVGHTSGACLAHGALAALAGLHPSYRRTA